MSFFWAVNHTGLNTLSEKKVHRIVCQTIGCVKKVGLHEAVVGSGMVFGEVIVKIIHPTGHQ